MAPTPADSVEIFFEESPIYDTIANAGPGTGAAPNRLSSVIRNPSIQTFQLDPAPALVNRDDEVRGIEGAVAEELEAYAPTGSFTQRAYLNDLVFWLQAAGFTDTITPGDGIITDPDAATIPATVYRHVFTKRTGTITAKTMEIILAYVAQGYFIQGNGYSLTTLGMSSAGELSGSLMGLLYQSVADPNLVLAYDSPAIPHVRRRDWTVPTWYSNRGAISDFSFQIAQALVPDRDPGVQSYFPTKMFMGDTRTKVTGTMAFSSAAVAEINQLLSAGTFAAKHRWQTPTNIAATSKKYTMWMDIPSCQYVGGNIDAMANHIRKGGSFNWNAGWDTVAGYDCKITILSSIASLETYV